MTPLEQASFGHTRSDSTDKNLLPYQKACFLQQNYSESRSGPHQDIKLQSGDLFVFGGAARMAFHGVLKIHPGTAPAELGIRAGRLNINMRETGFDDHTFDDVVEDFAQAFDGVVLKDINKE